MVQRSIRRLFVFVSLFATVVGMHAQGDLAFQRANHLRKGINLSMWYAQASDYSAARLTTYTTAEDFALVKSLGFDHVRVSINPEPLIEERQSGQLRADAMARLDATVQGLTSLGIAVVLDIHPENSYVTEVTTTDDGYTRFLNFWRNFAHHFAGTPANLVYFEVLNEPHGVDNFKWAGEQGRIVSVIRSQAPQHTIIATAGNWGGIDALLAIEPLRDDNVIYTFHDYQPFPFTHQSANWMDPHYIQLHGVPYPSSPEGVAPLLAGISDEVAKLNLVRYGYDRWSYDRLDSEIALAAQWARARHVPLWCGEFGAYKLASNPAERAHWVQDMRGALEHNGVGWAMWDYQGGFALVTKQGSTPSADPAIVKALGLSKR